MNTDQWAEYVREKRLIAATAHSCEEYDRRVQELIRRLEI